MFLATLIICTVYSFCAANAGAAEPSYVWWEAEDAATHSDDLSTNHGLNSHDERLSDGVSIGSDRAGPETALSYEVTVPSGWTWRFYARTFWHHGPFRCRWDDGDWRRVTRENQLLDNVSLAHHYINWKHAGKVDLASGHHTLTIEAIPQPDGSYGPFVLDCFVLTRQPLQVRGKVKPDAVYGLVEPGKWAFEPARTSSAPTRCSTCATSTRKKRANRASWHSAATATPSFGATGSRYASGA
jgi:hypothetical protein